jgi:hypothetical protein
MEGQYSRSALKNALIGQGRKFLVRGRIPIALLSFAIYLFAALLLYRQYHGPNAYNVERSSLAAAVSNVAYDAPFGAVFSEVLESFFTFVTPIDTLIEQAASGKAPSHLASATHDGNGFGYVVFATAAMRVFGPHLSSIIGLLFIVMAMSALAFIWRYRDDRLIALPLYFSSLTIMLFTPLMSAPNFANQFALGGIRFFSLVGILPAIHIFLEIADARDTETAIRWEDMVALGIQVVILVLAILIRNSAGISIVALALTYLAVAWIHRHNSVILRRTLFKGGYVALLSAALVGATLLSLPNYVRDGRTVSVFWHRVFIGFSLHPDWPFGNMRERYDCTKYLKEGINKIGGDQDGHCVWVAYALKHDISADKIIDGVYGGLYETVLRDAFLDVLRAYPRQAFETFFWYKPRAISVAIEQSQRFNLSGFSNLQVFLLIASIGLALVFGIFSSAYLWSTGILLLGGATVMFAAFSNIPYLVAFANPSSTGDLLLFCFFTLELAASATVATIFRLCATVTREAEEDWTKMR